MEGAIDVGTNAEEWKWGVESAADALTKAKEIQANPKLLKAARAELRKRRKAIDAALPGEAGRKYLKRRGKRE